MSENVNEEVDYDQDPELVDNEEEGAGDPSAYDVAETNAVEYDHSQFELPDDYTEEDDDEEGDEDA